MARDLLRMPKNVPREVARHIRASSRRIVKGGQVLSYENAAKLHDLLTTYRKTLTRESRKAVRQMEKARKPETRKRRAEEVATIREEAIDAERALADVARVEEEDVALEWECGVDYFEDEGWWHPKGGASDVSFNARLFRHDGHPMAETEAREAWMYFTDYGVMPREIGVAVVEWKRSKFGRVRRGTEADLHSFAQIMDRVREYGLKSRQYRMGSVKPDYL